MRRGRVFVGTSGWIYPHWRERFYPARLPAKQRLAFYASQLATVEINGTFYSLGRPARFAAWREQTPENFTFAVKGSRYLTHMLKLREPRAPLANFFAQGLLLLGKKIGPILWQLPPQLAFDADRARAFFDLLPRDLAAAERLARRHDHRLDGRSALTAPDGDGRPLRHALEVRHASWLDEAALRLVAEYDVALVTADSADHHPLSLERTSATLAYARLHGSTALYASRYSDRELDDWAALVDAWRRRGSDVYVYFDNDAKAYAPADARRLLDRVDPRFRRSPVDAHP